MRLFKTTPTVGLTNSAGALTATYRYDVYGRLRGTTGAPSATFTFAGEQTDVSGLVYLRARYYDPGTVRFLSQDPLPLPQRYAFVGGNPVNFADPAGLCRWLDCVDPRQLADPLIELLPEGTAFEIGGHFQISFQLIGTCFQFPEACAAAAAAAPLARAASFVFYGAAAKLEGDSDHPKEGDAFEHCTWSGLTTLAVGAGRAERVTSRYEARADNDEKQRDYDLHNNARGREFAEKLRASPSQGSSAAALVAYCRWG